MLGGADFFHVDSKPDGGLPRSLASPVVEMSTYYFHGGPPLRYEDDMHRVCEVLQTSAKGCLGHALGLTYEKLQNEPGTKEKAVVICTGWESVEAHMQFLVTQASKENTPLIGGIEEVETHHVVMLQT